MKVILLKDVPKIGRKYEVKDVPDGHALNFLLPRKLAERATADALRRLEAQKSKHALEVAESDRAFAEAIKQASDANATIVADANAEGSLYKAVKAEDIARAFAEKGITLPVQSIVIEAPIKHVGPHTIKLSSGGREAECVITVATSA